MGLHGGSNLRKDPQAYPLLPGQQLTGAVQIQTAYCCLANRRNARDPARHPVNLEMPTPMIQARMEQSNYLSAAWIHTGYIGPFVKITGTTCQRQIGIVIFSAVRRRDHVLHFEAEVEHQLRRMTVFTAMESASCY